MVDHVTVSADAPVASYTVVGSQSEFTFSFTVFAKTDLRVKVGSSELSQSDFTFSGSTTHSGGFQGGTITLNTAASNTTVIIWADVPPSRLDDLTDGQPLNIGALNTVIDQCVARERDHDWRLGRSLRVPVGEDPIGDLPSLSSRAGKLLGFDAAGAPIASAGSSGGVTVSAFMETVLDDTTASAALTTLGVSSFAKTLLDDTTAAAVRSTLGIGAGDAQTWTAKHTFQGGILIDTGEFSSTFIGSGLSANMLLNLDGTADSASVPEIGAQVTLDSSAGSANKATAYKIAFTSSVLADANSADIYGNNIIVQGHGNSYRVTGIEIDVNNIGANNNQIGGTGSLYGSVAVAAGSFESSAAYWATATTASSAKWTHGFVVYNADATAAKESAFADLGSGALRVLYATGTHTTGIDFGGATLSTFAIAPNNSPFYWKDSGGVARSVLNLASDDKMYLGYAGGKVESLAAIILSALPTSSSGLAVGQLWNDSGTLKVA